MIQPIRDVSTLERIKSAWKTPSKQPVAQFPAGAGGIKITLYGKHMARLEPGEWLWEESVNVYMFLLQQRDAQLCNADSRRIPSHYFNSFFFVSLLEPEGRNAYSYNAVVRWAGNIKSTNGDVFGLDKLVIPVSVTNNHWALAVAYIKDKKLRYFDSMGGRGVEYLKALKQYLIDESIALGNVRKLSKEQVQPVFIT